MSVDVSQDRLPDRNQTPGRCTGCEELELRVARLERASATSSLGDETKLGTTMCYWVCVGAHGMFAFFASCVPQFIAYCLPISIASLATLSICHVVSTRPVGHRSLRTILSVAVVMLPMLAGFYLSQGIDVTDLFSILFFFAPPAIACCWLIAKLFVWIAGWRIVAPSGSVNHPKLLIRHILVTTLLMAGVFAISRGFEIDPESVAGNDILMLVVYACLPAAFCTCIGCFLARNIFTKSGNQLVVSLIVLSVISTVVLVGLIAAILGVVGELETESFLYLAFYGLLTVAGIGLSTGGTFVMMRLAGYEFKSNKLLKEAVGLEVAPVLTQTSHDSPRLDSPSQAKPAMTQGKSFVGPG